MNIYFICIVILIIYKSKMYINKYNKDYFDKNNTSSINGVFVLLIFYSHLSTYTPAIYNKDFIMVKLLFFLSQLIVTPFLFFSGYGVYEKIKKDRNYVKIIPKKRIFNTWLKFCFAIILFILLDILLGININGKQIILSFLCWDSIGNSNWYIFCILWMYFITFLSFSIFKKNNFLAVMLNLILSILYCFIISYFKLSFWYNTALCYSIGILYSYYKDKIIKILKHNNANLLSLITLLFLFIFIKNNIRNFWYYELYSIIFVIIIAIISLKFRVCNKILLFFGKYTFWIYILQRIPMIFFSHTFLIKYHYKYSLVVFISTILLSLVTEYIFNKIIFFVKKLKHTT